jgi:hypothetical protein
MQSFLQDLRYGARRLIWKVNLESQQGEIALMSPKNRLPFGDMSAIFAVRRVSCIEARHAPYSARSKRSRFITLAQAFTKSFTNFSFPSAEA